ncbi:recombinase family protein [Streptomyces lydicus]|uniref:recombinase family protein n=1 Tax=Streptomyces lydicus TaxID=47763 RepID=UPI0037A548E7
MGARSPSTSTITWSPTPPKRPGAYLRISSDRFDLEAGVDRQLEDAEDSRTRLRWGPFAKVYRENDTSAFKKRKVIKADGSIDWMVLRPEFRQLLADLAHGVIDGVIFYDLDRLVRQPRDLEDLIDIVEYVKRPVTGATGGRMNLINGSDRHMARMMCVMALKSSEDTARRVARQHLSAAQDGLAQGRIAYGWVRKRERKGQLVPDEAGWSLVLFDDEGRPLLGTWEPIVTPKLWSQVQFEWQRRRQMAGIKPGESGSAPVNKYLLSGILRCQKCHRGLVGHSYKQRRSAKIIRNYMCPPSDRGGCGGTAITAPTADSAVEEAMNAFLRDQLQASKTGLDQSAGTITALQARLDQELARKSELIHRWSEGSLHQVNLTEEDYFTMLAALNRKISTLRESIATLEGAPPPKVAPETLLANWTGGSLLQKRAILKRYLHSITVQPPLPPSEFNRTELVKSRLTPRWKKAEEIAA